MATVNEWLERRRRIALDSISDVHTADPLNPGTVTGQAIREEFIETFGDGEFEPATWATLSGKPGTFPPEEHSHAWGDVTGKPSTFPPADHGHAVADVEGLQAIIDDLTARLAALETPEA